MPYRVTYGSYNNNGYYGSSISPFFNGQTLGGAVLGASVAPLLGISPIVGLGLGALLLGNNSSNTNIININTGRNYDYDEF